MVAVQSKPFSEAPDAILRSLARMAWASRAVAAELEGTLDGRERAEACPEGKFEGFNELLALGYMEGDAIGVSYPLFRALTLSHLTRRRTVS